jgi:ubiquinone/menaquinone biosynthesis C-methylase UbiE
MGDETHEEYQRFAKEMTNKSKGPTLKTDCWQEAEDFNPIQADYYCELYQELVDKAKAKGYNAVKGDIRKLPFEDKKFGLLMDFSTIDHIEDYEPALKEYNRVLKDDGNFFLVVWTSIDDGDFLSDEDSFGNPQYYFDYQTFKETLKKYFYIDEHDFFPYNNPYGNLAWFKCEKTN